MGGATPRLLVPRPGTNPLAGGELRFAARTFADVQNARKQIGNRIARKAAATGGAIDALWLADPLLVEPAGRRRKALPLVTIGDALALVEDETAKMLQGRWRDVVGNQRLLCDRYPLARLPEVPGLAWYSLARFLGETGHPVFAQPFHWEPDPTGRDKKILVRDEAYARTQRQWLAYCGFGDPERQRRAGMTQEELFACGSGQAKTAAYLIASTGMHSATGKETKDGKMRRPWPWRHVYDETKERTQAAHPEWKPWRHHKSAERVMTKAVLIHIYRTAWEDVYARIAAR